MDLREYLAVARADKLVFFSLSSLMSLKDYIGLNGILSKNGKKI
jgi:hypothetical protein